MSGNTFSLDDIRSAADAKYGNTTITVDGVDCVLVNALQLPKDKRKALTATQERLDVAEGEGTEGETAEDEADAQEQALRDALRIVCQNDHQADVLLNAIGDNMALLAVTFEKYSGETQAGEASPSAD